jgi:hypothetical protein
MKLWLRLTIMLLLGLLYRSLVTAQVAVERDIASSVRASVRHSVHMHIRDDDSDSEMPVREEETIRKTFAMNTANSPRVLEIDNVFGSIDVVGSAGDQAQLVVKKTIRAESKEKIEQAKKDVTLDINQQGNSVSLYVNGPFRCQCQGCVNIDRDTGYVVKMDFELQVPTNTSLKLKTVNEGHVKVQNVTGEYTVRNVNGGIEMLNVGGSGHARTVNGAVKVTFRENPHANSEYASLNGDVELYFARNLSADFRFKTFNGGVYSDFLLAALPQQAVKEERRNGKLILRADRYTGGRVGNGGPEIRVENFNGDIRVLERHD